MKNADAIDSDPTFVGRAVVACVTFSVGDVLAQWVSQRHLRLDSRRVLRAAVFGALFFTPVVGVWLSIVAILQTRQWPVWALVAADQFVWSPFFLLFYFACTAGLKGEALVPSLRQGVREIVPSMKVGVPVWSCVQLLNFGLVPPRHRMLVINIVSVPWNAFLAWRGSRSTGEEISFQSDKSSPLSRDETDQLLLPHSHDDPVQGC
ncbi:MAG: hypothetical protein MHM6MM_006981 [Cercozoa sp. M6MM]